MTAISLILHIFIFFVPRWILAGEPDSMMIITANHWFQFRADNSYCPLTDNKSTSNNAPIVTWDACYADTKHSWWRSEKTTREGTFTLKNRNSNLCLSVGTDLSDTGNNAPVVQYKCKNPLPATQMWTYDLVRDNNKDWLRLKGSGGRCISYNLNTPKGGAMYMYDCGCCDRWANQYFRVEWYNFVDL